jgi:hypothetical protein
MTLHTFGEFLVIDRLLVRIKLRIENTLKLYRPDFILMMILIFFNMLLVFHVLSRRYEYIGITYVSYRCCLVRATRPGARLIIINLIPCWGLISYAYWRK